MPGPVRWNLLVLATAMALNWSVVVIVAALTSLTIGHLFGLPHLAGLGFGGLLVATGAGGLVGGRLIDAWGRRAGLAAAFVVAAIGAATIYVGVSAVSLPVALAGLLIIGLGTGGASLARVAGADMFPPAQRPRGIALVLFGSAFGAIGAPIVFGPVLAAARTSDAAALAAPWPIAAVLLLAGALLLLVGIRIDPRQLAERLQAGESAADSGAADQAPSPPLPARPLRELLVLPMVPLALLAAIVAQAVMTATMALAGLVLADHGHDLASVSVTISLHFVGMFGLVLLVGPLVERLGRFRSVLLGLGVLAAGVAVLVPAVELANFVPGMFAVGLGWNIAYVASTAILADAAAANERGRLLGASDFLALLGGAVLSVALGVILELAGLGGMVVVGVLLALVPASLIALNRGRLEGARA